MNGNMPEAYKKYFLNKKVTSIIDDKKYEGTVINIFDLPQGCERSKNEVGFNMPVTILEILICEEKIIQALFGYDLILPVIKVNKKPYKTDHEKDVENLLNIIKDLLVEIKNK